MISEDCTVEALVHVCLKTYDCVCRVHGWMTGADTSLVRNEEQVHTAENEIQYRNDSVCQIVLCKAVI